MENLMMDTPENLRKQLNDLIKTIKRHKSEGLGWENPYNPIACNLRPEWWFGKGLPKGYYDQRIAIYNYVLKLADRVRGKWCSSMLCDFTERIKGYIKDSERLDKDLKEARKHSEWIRKNSEAIHFYLFGRRPSFENGR